MPVAGMVALRQAPVAGVSRAAVRRPALCGAFRPALTLTRRVALTAASPQLLRLGQQTRSVGIVRRRAAVAVAAPSVAPGTAAAGTASSSLTIGFPKETFAEEKRCGGTPETVAKLLKAGFGAVGGESGLGVGSGFDDAAYVAAGVLSYPQHHCLPTHWRVAWVTGRVAGTLSSW